MSKTDTPIWVQTRADTGIDPSTPIESYRAWLDLKFLRIDVNSVKLKKVIGVDRIALALMEKVGMGWLR